MQFNIAEAESCQSFVWQNKTVSMEDFIKRLSEPKITSETTEEYQMMSKIERQNAKDVGGFVGGYLENGVRKIENVRDRSMLTLDVDYADREFIDRYCENARYTSVLYTTHSHTPEKVRVRLVVFLTHDISPDMYNALARLFANELGIDLFDPVSFRPNQMMFWPSRSVDGMFVFRDIRARMLDPEEYLEGYPDWQELSTLPAGKKEAKRPATKQADPLDKSGIIGIFNRAYYPIQEALDTFLSDVYEPCSEDNRYSYIPSQSKAGVLVYNDRFVYSHHATDPAYGRTCNAFDIVRIHMFGDEKGSVKQMKAFAMKDSAVKSLMLEEKREQAEEDFGEINDIDTAFETRLEITDKGVIKNTIRNALLIMENDPELKGIAYNELAKTIEIIDDVPWSHPSSQWRDVDDDHLLVYIHLNYGNISMNNLRVALNSVSDMRSFHPIREYLEALASWDGVKRVEGLLIDYLGAEDNQYTRTVMKKALVAAIKRIYEPGVKFDYMIVMNGPQGIGKSTLISKLGGPWYSDSLAISDMNDKTSAEKVQGIWLMEIGELAGMRKADIDKVKAFLSRQDDRYRAAYGTYVTVHPRQTIFFGTTNADNGFLRDTTGNRRFWSVSTPGSSDKHPWDLTHDDVDQIWAEAKVYADQGEELFLDHKLEKMAQKEQDMALEGDEREGLISRYLEMKLPEDWDKKTLYERRNYFMESSMPGVKEGTVVRERVCAFEIFCECFGKEKGDYTGYEAAVIGRIMKKIDGWEKGPDTKRDFGIYGRQRFYQKTGS